MWVRGDISEEFQEIVISVDGGRCSVPVLPQHGDEVAHR